MQKILMVWAVSCYLLLPATAAWSGEHRLGGGVNYWVALEDLDEDDVDEDGFSYLISYQYMMDWIGVELDVELLPDRFGDMAGLIFTNFTDIQQQQGIAPDEASVNLMGSEVVVSHYRLG